MYLLLAEDNKYTPISDYRGGSLVNIVNTTAILLYTYPLLGDSYKAAKFAYCFKL